LKFLVDMPLSPSLANWPVNQGHDAVHAVQVGMQRAADELIMGLAVREHRVLITADLDYPRMLALAQANGPGLILFRGGDFNERTTTVRLQKALELVAEPEMKTSILVIEKDRIRKRRLPIQRE
jgi:predicted nuclease of predicted toxin-antitoxin system